MSKMDDEKLLDILQDKEESAAKYVYGTLAPERDKALREYYRMPYGNEEEGWSTIVSSDVQDTVEWILPSLLKIFSSTDKAVSFEPTKAEDVKGAEQATDACNYVFYKQNNGFLTLYTAIKDMLTVHNCAVHWRKETKETVSTVPFKGATDEMMALLLQQYQGAEIQDVDSQPMAGPDGLPVVDELGNPVMLHTGRIKVVEERKIIKVDAFNPDDLLVDRRHTSPILDDSPYVARLMQVTVTDLKAMGFDVDADDLRSSENAEIATHHKVQQDGETVTTEANDNDDDDSMAEGWLRIEYVIVDYDGDGVAERREIYRLKDKILRNEVCGHVPMATASPILNTHQWDGMSMADAVSDLQKLHTELLRQTVNNLYLTNNPRKKVLTDANWSPLANIDDLLDSRPGGVLRQRDPNAITDDVTPFAAAATMPMLEYVQGMRENRTGVSRTSMGLNPDSLNNTATGRQIDMTAAQQRIELIARITAEMLLKPIFKGILKLLTDGDMQRIAFRLRDEFVEYDPNEWRDSYDMTINVGLGTGDTTAKAQQLVQILSLQKEALAAGLPLVTPKHLYNTAAKLVENAGFKDVQNFLQDPDTAKPTPKPPPIEVQVEEMRQKGETERFYLGKEMEIQKFQAEIQKEREVEHIRSQAKLQEQIAALEVQKANDERDAERETLKAQLQAQMAEADREFERWKAELDAQTRIYIEQLKLGSQQPVEQQGDLNNALAVAIDGFRAAIEQMSRPKTIVRGPDGKAQGIM